MRFTEKYPQILKIDQISPNLKPDKNSENIDSYRPINNLSKIDKIIEEFFKQQINTFIDLNNIILDEHHRSLKDHSTLTALSIINYELVSNYSDDKVTTIIQTDLSAAFDMVDHDILIKKMDHYGLRGKCLNIVQSFLSNRIQYVSIDAAESTILPSLNCSVIQGSKLSALLYTLYINEVTLLHKLVGEDFYQTITDDDILMVERSLEHLTIQYVDDSNNIITSDSSVGVECYTHKYFNLLENFYDFNKLRINPDKSKLMIVVRPNKRSDTDKIVLKSKEYTIHQV